MNITRTIQKRRNIIFHGVKHVFNELTRHTTQKRCKTQQFHITHLVACSALAENASSTVKTVVRNI